MPSWNMRLSLYRSTRFFSQNLKTAAGMAYETTLVQALGKGLQLYAGSAAPGLLKFWKVEFRNAR